LIKTFWDRSDQTTARRHIDLEVAVRADLHHHPRQCAAVPQPLQTHWHTRAGPQPAALCWALREDAPTATHPRPKPGQLHHQPTPTQRPSTPSRILRPRTPRRRRRAAALL